METVAIFVGMIIIFAVFWIIKIKRKKYTNAMRQAWDDLSDIELTLTKEDIEDFNKEAMIKLGYLSSKEQPDEIFEQALAKFASDFAGIADKKIACKTLYLFWRKDLPIERIPLRFKVK